jgi:chromosome segregation ATPase
VSYLTGQLSEKDNSRSQVQVTLNEKVNTINQLQQQIAEKNATMIQLQTLFSRCDNEEVSRRIQELSQALTSEIERQQTCLQTINQLNSENTSLKITRDLLVELNNKYPKVLPSFVYEIQQPGNVSAIPEINNWAKEEVK